MLRINLLPAYIAEQRRVTYSIILCVLLFLIVTAAPLAYYFAVLNPRVVAEKALDDDEKPKAQEETAYEAATATLKASIQPLLEKVFFVQNVQFHNTIRQKIFKNAAQYTYRHVELDSMSVSGSTLSLTATVSSLDDIGRFYLGMFANPDVTAVSFTGVPDRSGWVTAQPQITPGGPPPAPAQFHIAMNATIVKPVVTPTLPASLTGGAAGGGAPGGMVTSMPGSAPSGGMPPGSGLRGPAAAPAGRD